MDFKAELERLENLKSMEQNCLATYQRTAQRSREAAETMRKTGKPMDRNLHREVSRTWRELEEVRERIQTLAGNLLSHAHSCMRQHAVDQGIGEVVGVMTTRLDFMEKYGLK